MEIHLQMPPKLVRNAIKFSRRDSGKALVLPQADRCGCVGVAAPRCSLQTEQTGEPSESGALKPAKNIAVIT